MALSWLQNILEEKFPIIDISSICEEFVESGNSFSFHVSLSFSYANVITTKAKWVVELPRYFSRRSRPALAVCQVLLLETNEAMMETGTSKREKKNQKNFHKSFGWRGKYFYTFFSVCGERKTSKNSSASFCLYDFPSWLGTRTKKFQGKRRKSRNSKWNDKICCLKLK